MELKEPGFKQKSFAHFLLFQALLFFNDWSLKTVLICHSRLMLLKLLQMFMVDGFRFTIDLTHFSDDRLPFLESQFGELFHLGLARMQTYQQAL